MCPTCIVLTDSPYVPATDTLAEIGCKSTKNRGKGVLYKMKKVRILQSSFCLDYGILLYLFRFYCFDIQLFILLLQSIQFLLLLYFAAQFFFGGHQRYVFGGKKSVVVVQNRVAGNVFAGSTLHISVDAVCRYHRAATGSSTRSVVRICDHFKLCKRVCRIYFETPTINLKTGGFMNAYLYSEPKSAAHPTRQKSLPKWIA